MSDMVYLRIHINGGINLLGSWAPADAKVNNIADQQHLGWHVFNYLQRGADKIEVVIGDMDADSREIERVAREEGGI